MVNKWMNLVQINLEMRFHVWWDEHGGESVWNLFIFGWDFMEPASAGVLHSHCALAAFLSQYDILVLCCQKQIQSWISKISCYSFF